MTDVTCIFHFGIFSAVTPLTTKKKKIKTNTKKKNHLEVSSFYTCVPKILIRTVPKKYGVRQMGRRTGGQKK